MLAELARTHPIEGMVLNAVLNVPVLYLAFTLAAVNQERWREGLRGPRVLLLVPLVVGGLWGLSTIIDTVFVKAIGTGAVPGPGALLANPLPTLYPATCAIILSLIRSDGRRGVALVGFVCFALVFVSRLPFDPEFLALDGATRARIWLTIAIGTLSMGYGAALMTTSSHPGRTAAVVLVAWGTKLLIYARLSGEQSGATILEASTGTITPLLVWAITALVVGAGIVASTEVRRLRDGDMRNGVIADAEARMRTLANAAHEALVMHRGGVIVDTNDSFRKMIGGDAVRGRPLATFLQASDDASPDDFGTGTVLRPDGGLVPVETICSELGDGRYVTSLRDLSRERADRARIEELATIDALTGVPNRRSFEEALSAIDADWRAKEGDGTERATLLIIDLDRFKPVNDTYGHTTGDRVLAAVAQRLGAAIGAEAQLYRIGGDEFAVLLGDVGDEAAERLAGRMLEAARRPVAVGSGDGIGADVRIGASVGIAQFPEHASTGEELRGAADLALYAAKQKGRDRAVRFEPAMAAEATARLRNEADLREALARNQIELHYQVQHDLKAGGVVGYEALMRWRHPARGMVSPGEFIPIAEETGLIVDLGRWALHRAARDFAGYDDRTRVSVNVSPIQFERSDVVADIRAALEGSGLPAWRLEIEVTEQLLLDTSGATLAALRAIRAMGATLSLDDFGSGYSSLSYLTRYPFSKIKIDRTFIDAMTTDARADALVRSILALAASLDLRVTAEGVETHGQLAHLARGRCDEAQGFLLGRPTPFADLMSDLPSVGGRGTGAALAS